MSLLWQPRWIVGHVLVLIVVVAFVRLGVWQLDRHGQLLDRNATIERTLEQAPISLGEALAADDGVAYRRVRLAGRFDPAHELLLRNRTYLDQPGFHVLTPFVLETPIGDASAILVDRGWVPHGLSEPPVEEAPPPAGTQIVEGILLPEEDPPTGPLARFAARDPAQGAVDRVVRVDVDRIAPQLPYGLVPAYLIPTSAPAAVAATELPVPAEPPGPETGTHLAYALQWFAFVLITIVGYALLLRVRVRETGE